MNSTMKFSKEDIVLTLWIFAALFYNTSNFKLIGSIFVFCSVGVMLISGFRTGFMQNRVIFLFFAWILLVYLVGAMRNPTLASLKTVGLLLITIIVFFFVTNANICHVHIKRLKLLIGTQLIILIIPSLFHVGINPVDGGFMSIYANTTFLGIFSCALVEVCLLFFLYDRSKIWIFYSMIYVCFVYLSKVRTSWVGVLLIVVLTLLFKQRRKKIELRFFKYVFYGLIVIFIVAYPMLPSFSWFDKVSDFVYLHTGKILMSGRNVIWAEAIPVIKDNLSFGLGLDFISEYDVQLHNSYLQILMQTGLIGLVPVFLLINKILNDSISKVRQLELAKYSVLFSLVNILMCCTEVMLLQGQLILQLLIWSILALGLNRNNIDVVLAKRAEIPQK